MRQTSRTRSQRRIFRSLLLLLAAGLSAGCAADVGEPPFGPGATSQADLRPWLASAPTVSYTGRLQHFHCASQRGGYYTWSLDPAGPRDAAEVDVRACPEAAQALVDQRVTITGKWIPRDPQHFPILVAERIEAASDGVFVTALPPRPAR